MSGASGSSREERAARAAALSLATPNEVAGATVLTVAEAPGSPMLNRVVGLGVGAPATEEDVDAALAAIGAGVTFYAAVAPSARPAGLPGWLEGRGLEPSWGWMTFRREVSALPASPTSLRLVEVQEPAGAAVFARVVADSYGLPVAVQPRLAALRDAGWLCLVALDGDEPAGAAALLVTEGVGYLGLAGTLAEHRGKGAQSALLAERIRRAAELGCDLLVTETGERVEGRPSDSYRNILRAGFTEVEVTANWLGRS